MQIRNQIYIPDRETFEANHAGEFTDLQKKHLYISKDFPGEINHTREKFIYFLKNKCYAFEKAHIDYSECVDPTIPVSAKLLPGIVYDLYSLDMFNDDDIFLSAKAIEPVSEESVYQTMISALSDFFTFSLEDLDYNKKNKFSPSQRKKFRIKKNEYDRDPDLGVCEFLFTGYDTINHVPYKEKFIHQIEYYFSDEGEIFLFNVRYKIYYEPKKKHFLSIEPLEIVENVLPTQFSPHSPVNTAPPPPPPKPEPRERTLPEKKFSGVYLVFFYLTAIFYILLGIFISLILDGGGCIGIPTGIFGIWFLYLAIKSLPKEEDKSKQ